MELISIRNVGELMQNSPALFSAEFLTYLCFLLAIIHAFKNGRNYLLLLFFACIPATAIDPFCLVSPEMRNYYHDHAFVLLFDRHVAPWQFGLFALITYLPAASIWPLHLSLLEEMAAVGFLATFNFHNLDMLGSKYLLWTWHDFDPLYLDRASYVPCGSSYWVMSYAMIGSLFARLIARFKWSTLSYFIILPLTVLIFLPAHLIPFFFYDTTKFLGYRVHGNTSVTVFYSLCVFLFLIGMIKRKFKSEENIKKESSSIRPKQFFLNLSVFLWFLGLLSVVFFLNPADVRSTSFHQPFGVGETMCSEIESYYWGSMQRKKYICEEDMADRGLWYICGKRPQAGEEYYTICGTSQTNDWKIAYISNAFVAIITHIFVRFQTSQPTIKKD